MCDRLKELEDLCQKLQAENRNLRMEENIWRPQYKRMFEDYKKIYSELQATAGIRGAGAAVNADLVAARERITIAETALRDSQGRIKMLEEERTALRMEVHILRERERLSQDDQYALLYTKYKWLLGHFPQDTHLSSMAHISSVSKIGSAVSNHTNVCYMIS